MSKSASVPILRTLVMLLTLSFAAHAYADDRSEARTHYQAGVRFYGGGDYRGAIREFSAAQQLAPADLNNYNLALCYDKLGDAEPAIQYYRAFLDKQPSSDKRAEIEASINRLESASRSASSKKDEAKKADEARRADDAKKADDAAPIGPSAGPSPAIGPSPGPIGPSPEPPAEERKPPKRGPAVAGSIGTPSTGSPVQTGDQQLDRVNSINIDDVRDQRVGGAGSGMTDRSGPPTAGAAQPGQPGQPGQPAAPPPGDPNAPGPAIANSDQPKKETPVYKKWWFWVVMGVSAVVVYELSTSSSRMGNNRGRESGLLHNDPVPGGATLLRW
ncbi:MAG: tetratricopeptide repeat protein [bacterium]